MAFLRTVLTCSANRKYGLLSNSFCSLGKINTNRNVLKSTAAGAIVQEGTSTVATSPKDPLDITFEDPKAAFKSKTNWELIRAYIVYTLCSFEYLVDNNMKVSRKRSIFGGGVVAMPARLAAVRRVSIFCTVFFAFE